MSTVWQRFTALPGHKRVLVGVAGMVLSSLGLYFSDELQKQDPQHKSPLTVCNIRNHSCVVNRRA